MRSVCAGFGLALAIALASCSESRSASPARPSPVEAAPAPARPWSLVGRVSALQDAAAVEGAEVSGAGQTTLTQADGAFLLEGTEAPLGSFYPLEITRPGFLTRQVFVQWSEGPRGPFELTMIRDAQPFSAAFYRQFVRNATEAPQALDRTRRWAWGPPNFYVKTSTGLGALISNADRDLIIRLVRELVPVLTGGVYAAGRIESGPEDRNELNWITIEVAHIDEPVCGRAYVGTNPGRIWINRNQGQCYSGSCATGEAIRAETVAHELAHALGFFHTDGATDIMNSHRAVRNCDSTEFSANERYHAWVAYQRPRDNRDPDRDPQEQMLLRGGSGAGGPLVTCWAGS